MGAAIAGSKRGSLSFRSVNRRGAPGYDAGLQRHHLLPRQLLSCRCFSALFDQIGRAALGFDDFRRNGILLPAREEAVWRTLLPLHRGPHRDYNEMVMERVGTIEARWARRRAAASRQAGEEAIFRLGMLQNALRKRLLDQSRRLVLNRRDPVQGKPDFSELDAMAEALFRSAA